MNLLKRISFFLFVGLGLAFATWAYFHLRESKKPSLKAVDILPDSAVCVFTSNNFPELNNKLKNQNLLWNELISIKEFNTINYHINYFDSIINENELLNEFFNNHEVILAIYNSGNKTGEIIAFNLKDLKQGDSFVEHFKTIFREFKTVDDHFEFVLSGSKWYAVVRQGVVALSNTLPQLNRAFSENTRKLKDSKYWKELHQLHGEPDLLNCYSDHSKLHEIEKTSEFNSHKIPLSGRLLTNAEISPDAFSLNGFNIPDSASLLNAFINQKAQPCDFLGILPFSTCAFKAYGFNDFMALRKQLKVPNTDFWRSVNDSAMFNVENEFYANLNSKLIDLKMKHNNSVVSALAVEIKDSAKAGEHLFYLSDSLIRYGGQKLGHLKPDRRDLTKVCFGNIASTKAEYMFIYGTYFFVTETKEAAELYINSLLNNSSLVQNEMFAAYAKDNFGLNFNYLSYNAIAKQTHLVKEIFEFIDESKFKFFDKISDVSLCVSNYKNVLQFRFNAKYQEARQNKEVPGLWTFEADTAIISRPYLFVNHKTSENELAFQDAANNLNLVNAAGRLLWKKQVNEPITSEVFIVDAFKNNKYQLLFNTRNYIHLVDRNGKDVEGFPVKLPAQSTNGLTLLDYDGTKDYRLFIACADNKIYNYGITGIQNEKFVPVKTDNSVTLGLSYLKVAGSDYLLTSDIEGKLYVFSRRGEGRIDFKNKLTRNCKRIFTEAAGSIQNTRVIYMDEKNSLLEDITLADKKSAVKLNTEFENAVTSFDLIDDDKKTDIVIADADKVKCYDLSGNELFFYPTGSDKATAVNYFYDSDGAFFFLNTASEELQVIRASDRKVSKRFKATSEPLICDLFKDGKKYILAADHATLKCVMLK